METTTRETVEREVARLRDAIMRDLAHAKDSFEAALRPENPNTFVWHKGEFWVDRVRRIVFDAGSVDPWRSHITLPDDGERGEARELLELDGGDARFVQTSMVLNLFARLVCGIEHHHSWLLDGARTLNLAVAQPSVNPALEPLFWLALADDCGPSGYRENLYELVGPMTYQMMAYPERTPHPSDVRRAQIAFLEELFPGTTDPACEQLSDTQWAERCDQELRRHQAFVDQRVFVDLLLRARVAARETDARPLP